MKDTRARILIYVISHICNIELIDRVAEKTSLEGWTKVADNAFRNWQSNIQDIDLSSMLKKKCLSLASLNVVY